MYENNMLHELWVENETDRTFCLAGPRGDAARKMLAPGAKLVWTVQANSHFEAMTLYYAYMGWGEYKSDYPALDKKTYKELGFE